MLQILHESPRARVHPQPASRSSLGTAASTSRSVPSTSTSAGCARRSRVTASTGSCRRCTEPATDSRASRSDSRGWPRPRGGSACGILQASDCRRDAPRGIIGLLPGRGSNPVRDIDPMTISRARVRGSWRLLAAGSGRRCVVADYLLRVHALVAARRGVRIRLAWHVYHVHLLARWLASGARRARARNPRNLGPGVRVSGPDPASEPQAQEAAAQGRDAVSASGGGDARRRDRPGRGWRRSCG